MLNGAFLALAIALVLPPTFAARQSRRQGPCHSYVLVSSRGTNEPQGPSMQFKGMIEQTLNTLPNGIEVDNPYPADSSAGSARQGQGWLRNFVEQGLKTCPAQKYALLGWSQGAVVAAGSGVTSDAVQAIILVGDPFHTPNRSGNVDEHGGSSTTGATGLMGGSGGGSAMRKYADEGKVLDICFQGDFVCGSTAPRDPAAHGRYGGSKEVQELGAAFLIKQLRG
ncbi:hypothetical protein OC834_003617 [Tilletia horrida]|nr:hypothetical protein OC834_003617 [Tilletia horrida]